jgi:hypothetical protein
MSGGLSVFGGGAISLSTAETPTVLTLAGFPPDSTLDATATPCNQRLSRGMARTIELRIDMNPTIRLSELPRNWDRRPGQRSLTTP